MVQGMFLGFWLDGWRPLAHNHTCICRRGLLRREHEPYHIAPASAPNFQPDCLQRCKTGSIDAYIAFDCNQCPLVLILGTGWIVHDTRRECVVFLQGCEKHKNGTYTRSGTIFRNSKKGVLIGYMSDWVLVSMDIY